ncbi:hypothetical protein [Spiroplasma turonicum]|uniref:Transmembrane protein n=1 Tax=Spiroplasma turonicum TaxID=216946 RepID=A0A0K1P6E7_9MOLU|nr:hypothetical protein [Spiroplasma turonicum]AKU79891.1 unknown lipoprotein [Spiroplasma turonicum]ALX70902.1 hypothetical protein STURO_v1c06430 [Spiroplasma turonicum]
MKLNERENSKFVINSSCAVFIVTTLLFVISCIYIGIYKRFSFWYIFPIIISIQLTLTIIYVWYIKVKIDIYGNYNNDKNIKWILILVFLELFTLNLFAFVYGLYTYIKLFVKNNKSI